MSENVDGVQIKGMRFDFTNTDAPAFTFEGVADDEEAMARFLERVRAAGFDVELTATPTATPDYHEGENGPPERGS